jgi:hypothetical protein
MSSSYCVQLTQNILVLSMTTANPINFTSLQFSLSVNSLVIFLFSKYPFNFGYANNFCVNEDEFGFAQVGQTFDIDLSNYQNYYMLILIYPQGINFGNYGSCNIVSNFTMTFQNTTISPVQNITVNSNFANQKETGFCTCYNNQPTTPSGSCINYSVYSVISLSSLNNYLVIMTCQGFLIQNNTTVEFITPHTCSKFGGVLSAEIVFGANSQVIDFLNSNSIKYSIISSSTCQLTSKLPSCVHPCKSFSQIANLLSPPTKYSIISSKLWNEIVQDLYLAYSVYKYISYLMQYPYPQYIYPAILDFYNFYENFEPYPFTSLLKAQKGIPLTANDFNKLIDAIVKLANENDIKLQKQLNKVQHDQIVKASQFSNIVYDVNQFLTFNHNQYFLISCTGNEFNNLLNSISTFLTVLIKELIINITIPSNVYIKNLLIYETANTISAYGSIGNLVINQNNYRIFLYNNSSINLININIDNKGIILNNNAFVNTINVGTEYYGVVLHDYSTIEVLNMKDAEGGVNINNNSSINLLTIETDNDGVILNNNSFIDTINIQTENYGIYLHNDSTLSTLNIETDNGGVSLFNNASANKINIGTENHGIDLLNNAYINTLYVGDNVGGIYLYDNAVIENLICKQNPGGVYISGNAKIINNQCS